MRVNQIRVPETWVQFITVADHTLHNVSGHPPGTHIDTIRIAYPDHPIIQFDDDDTVETVCPIDVLRGRFQTESPKRIHDGIYESNVARWIITPSYIARHDKISGNVDYSFVNKK